ncbi:MAG: 5-formyltetrahydrofolate cyclo-ligase [Sandaracinaceae bacterium]|nr:5-formyltetrahydrofolate cyclo-ligase [Sandaracinaceae bacterium]
MTDGGPRSKSGQPEEMSAEYEEHLRRQVKNELRKRMKAVRKTLPHEARLTRARAICEKLVALDAWKNARTVSLYMAMREEVHLDVAIDAARADGKVIAMPRVDDETDLLVLHEWRADDAMATSAFGVAEPLASAPRIPGEAVDLVIVPALAFDDKGHRIGYGAGYYDRLLPTLANAVRIGIAFDFQLIAEAPVQANDVPVHTVVTDARVLSAIPLAR